MRICPKCRKANLSTRKFCIRCGASLLKPVDSKPVEAEPVARTTLADTTPFAAPPKIEEQPSPITEDKWVRPSQVSTDRVRSSRHSSTESELEKARRAFAKAEEVGIDEEGTGVVETRMLRASEVKELLEGPGAMAEQPEVITEDTEGTPSGDIVPIQAPSTEDMEHQILGEWSTLVAREDTPLPESKITEPSESPVSMSVEDSTGFSSARYAETSEPPSAEETPTATEPIAPIVREEVPQVKISAEHVITCPHCKSIITLDDFEYPAEIYSAMGNARIKQARYLIVQGRENDAIGIAKIARVLFEKANDGDGLAQIEQLADSLSSGS